MFNRPGIVFIIYLIGCLTGCAVKQENTELKQLFDLNWKFQQGDFSSAIAVDFNDAQWRNLDLPHDWSTDGKLDDMNSGLEEDTSVSSVGWYRKQFILPSEWQNKSVAIYFEGCKRELKVYLNENLLAENTGTSDSLHYDLTPHLNYDNKNIIALRVNTSPQTNGKWLKGTGIPQHVWLLVTDPVRSK